jgi:NAD-dependent SIR2 family protein deacetylase
MIEKERLRMAYRFHIKSRPKSNGTWEPDRQLTQAIAERDRFLARYPQYRQMQNEIDDVLDKAGSSENRMAVMALLIESKLIELHGQLQHLNRILLSVEHG